MCECGVGDAAEARAILHRLQRSIPVERYVTLPGEYNRREFGYGAQRDINTLASAAYHLQQSHFGRTQVTYENGQQREAATTTDDGESLQALRIRSIVPAVSRRR